MSRHPSPIEETKRYRVYQILVAYAVDHRGLPCMAACCRIVNEGLRSQGDDTISAMTCYTHLQRLAYRDNLLAIDQKFLTVSIVPSELVVFEENFP
jgi:hypothetical protein